MTEENENMTEVMNRTNATIDGMIASVTDEAGSLNTYSFFGYVSNFLTQISENASTVTEDPRVVSLSMQTYGHAMLCEKLAQARDESWTDGQIIDATKDVFYVMLKPIFGDDDEDNDSDNK